MITLMMKKIRSKKGESFAEVLISILVMSFALLILATMITVSWRLVQMSTENEQFRQLSLEDMDSFLADPGIAGPTYGDSCKVKFVEAVTNSPVRLNDADGNYDPSGPPYLNARCHKTTRGSETLFSYWPVPD